MMLPKAEAADCGDWVAEERGASHEEQLALGQADGQSAEAQGTIKGSPDDEDHECQPSQPMPCLPNE